ncbi:MAG TPA: hypothetical protein VND64_22735 [Pirellulales bacterium]|nr:hypothetical protein [Pirellulales bacterium]
MNKLLQALASFTSSASRGNRRNRRPPSTRGVARRWRPTFETLEGRTVLSAYTAATAPDLIADINAANQHGGANSITLTAPTTAPYVLTAVNNSTDGATGTPEISGGTKKLAADNLTIIGSGDTIERSTAGGGAFRLFDVAAGGSLTLENLTLGNGLAYGAGSGSQGGAVRNQGTLLLSQVTVGGYGLGNEAFGFPYQTKKSSSSGDAAGGGIWSSGALTVENQSVIQFNTVVGEGNGSGYGGGIAIVGGTADIDSTTIGYWNWALGGYDPNTGSYAPSGPGAGYGGGIYVGGGTVTLTNDVIDGNSAGFYINEAFEGFDNPGYGGGIYIASGATVQLDTYTWDYTRGNTGLFPSAETDIYGQFTLLP